MQRLPILLLILALGAVGALADTIMSAPGGGLWTDPDSWIGGAVPDADDQVIIDSAIQVPGTQACFELNVTGNGLLSSTGAGIPKLVVADRVLNYGSVEDGSFWFDLEIGGAVVNGGSWSNHLTVLTGAGEISFKSGFPAVFASDLVLSAGGDLLVETPVHLLAGIDLGGGTLTLNPGCHLTVEAGNVTGGDFHCAGNELRFLSWTYLSHCVVDRAVFVGTVSVGPLVDFTGGTTNTHTLQNESSFGNGHVDITGGLVNLGLIRNDSYGFTIVLGGDLVNDGVIQNSWLQLDGQSEHHLSGGPDGVIDTNIFLPEFQGGTIVVDSPLRFEDGISLAGGTMILSPGSDLSFGSYAGITSGELQANGNTIAMDGFLSTISQLTVDRAVLAGEVQIGYEATFTGGVTVLGSLTTFEFGAGAAVATVRGTLRNEGHVRDSAYDFELVAEGDIVNLGTMDNARVALAGQIDQHVAAGAGIAVPAFVIESGIVAAGYQWYRDGVLLPGENGSSLTLVGVGSADYGGYRCEGAGGEMSRLITIEEFADPTGAPPVFAGAVLEQNHPNPFNPATEIAFSLAEAGRATLGVYDAAGRLVDVLQDGNLGAGRHTLTWRPEREASGIYFYRLEAGSQTLLRKAVLIK